MAEMLANRQAETNRPLGASNVAVPLTPLQKQILGVLQNNGGAHVSGRTLAAFLTCNERTIREAIKRLRFDHDRWDILSRAGNNPDTDGYWISDDPAEIEENRRYHEKYGKDHLARAGRMQAHRSITVDQTHG